MTVPPQSTATTAIALLGALAGFGVTLWLYEPRVPDDEAEPAVPLVEAAFFFVVFAVVFGVVGLGFSFVERAWGRFGSLLVFVVAGIGLYSVYATGTGRMGAANDPATRALGVVTGAVIGLLGIAVLLL